ncbi:MAG: GNAT family N-acetyltransferase [Calditrichaeota bacterium]|nr:GNAT family N-acetyltransferase [Calditrichota bacterium]
MRLLESERLMLKPIEEEDIYVLLEIRWDWDVMFFSLHEPISRREQLEWYRSLSSKKDLALSVFLKTEQGLKLVGTIGLYDINPRHQRATFRMRLSKESQGLGIGFEAGRMLMEYGFNVLNLRKICGDQFAVNKAAVTFCRRMGFVEEGVLRKHFYQNGEFRDVSFVGLLKEDFFAAMGELDKQQSTGE